VGVAIPLSGMTITALGWVLFNGEDGPVISQHSTYLPPGNPHKHYRAAWPRNR